MRQWVNLYAAFYTAPSKRAARYQYLPAGTVIESLGEQAVDSDLNIFERVAYGGRVGWVQPSRLDTYVEHYPRGCVDLADIETPSTTDAAQYILWGGVKHNACGLIALCYVFGMKLSEMLGAWKLNETPLHKRMYGRIVGNDTGTSDADLIDICAFFHQDAQRIPLERYTPSVLHDLVSKGGVIVSCHIDRVSGRLRGQGPLHWAVVVNVIEERTGYGLVEVFNPFPNRVEVYSWAEFIASTGGVYGVVV